MNKLYAALVVWLVVAGLLGGVSINQKAERCGHPVTMNNEDALWWLTWPMAFAAAVTLDGKNLAYSPCGDNPDAQ